MFVFDNIVVFDNEWAMMMNLYSFRRRTLSPMEIELIKSINIKSQNLNSFSAQENKLIELLTEEKQILSKKDVHALDEFMKVNSCNTQNESWNIYQLTFLLSFSWNLDCTYCYQKAIDRNPGHISVQDVRDIKETFNQYNKIHNLEKTLETIVITGGETLLSSHIAVINEIITQFKDDNIKVILFTNGINLKDYCDELLLVCIDEIHVSLDSIKDIHMRRALPKNRVFDDIYYDNIIDGIKMAVNLEKHVKINACIDKEIYIHVPEFIKMLREEGILDNENVELQFGTVSDDADDYGLSEEFNSKEDILDMRSYFKDNIPEYLNSTTWLPRLGRLEYLLKREWNSNMPVHTTKTCLLHSGICLSLLPGGDIVFCDYTGKEMQIVGNYYAEKYISIKKIGNYIGATIQNVEKCDECMFRYVCRTGCPKQQDVKGNPVCGIYRDDFIMENLGGYLF